jgi:tetratricopeptide (TPR) repeat protein
VLVTSRRHLSALEDATAVSLDTLPPQEAAGLLVRLAGRPGLGPEDAAVAEMTRMCGYLPLAIGMVARQLHHHPAWTAAGRAAELAAALDRLELITTENVSVAAAFDLSYADLAPDQQRLFRRLGLHPGADIDAYAATALDGTGLAAARRGLEALYDQYLLTEPTQGRYRMHDLIREHARALAGRLDPDDDRDQATARLLDYYQHLADLIRQARTVPVAGTIPAVVPILADRDQAMEWVRAERANLIACLDEATATGQHARIIALTAGLAGLLRLDGPWAEALTREAAAVRAAEHLCDRPGQATALHDLGIVRRLTGDYPGAAQALEEALGIYRDTSDGPGQASALNNLGMVRRGTGDYPGAARALEEALGIYRDIGDRGGEAEALNERGMLYRVSGDRTQAEGCHRQALDLARAIATSRDEAHALAGLGRCALAAGHTGEAEDMLRQALEIFQRIGAAEAAEVSAELESLNDTRPAAHGS